MDGQRFAGKAALVTGGGLAGDRRVVGVRGSEDLLGVGAAISVLLAAEGCSVGVVDRDLEHAKNTVALIERAGGTALAVEADVSDSNACRKAIEEVLGTYRRLDVLMNNAGIRGTVTEDGPNRVPAPLLPEVSEDDWDRTMNVNVKGMMLMAMYAAPHFRDGAAIVNIASAAAVRPLRGTAAYATSKGAVMSLTYAMAVDMAPTRANCVSPGRVWTPMVARKLAEKEVEAIRTERRSDTLVGTEGTAMDIAHAAAFLASDDARWISGQVLLVDGGASLRPGGTGKASGW